MTLEDGDGESNMKKQKIKIQTLLSWLFPSNSSLMVCVIFSSVKKGEKVGIFPCWCLASSTASSAAFKDKQIFQRQQHLQVSFFPQQWSEGREQGPQVLTCCCQIGKAIIEILALAACPFHKYLLCTLQD